MDSLYWLLLQDFVFNLNLRVFSLFPLTFWLSWVHQTQSYVLWRTRRAGVLSMCGYSTVDRWFSILFVLDCSSADCIDLWARHEALSFVGVFSGYISFGSFFNLQVAVIPPRCLPASFSLFSNEKNECSLFSKMSASKSSLLSTNVFSRILIFFSHLLGSERPLA